MIEVCAIFKVIPWVNKNRPKPAPERLKDVVLPAREKEFATQLSIRQRKIFCGKFNEKQRQMAIKYSRGRGKDSCFTPDEAVTKVMEETGMSLAVKGRSETDQAQ